LCVLQNGAEKMYGLSMTNFPKLPNYVTQSHYNEGLNKVRSSRLVISGFVSHEAPSLLSQIIKHATVLKNFVNQFSPEIKLKSNYTLAEPSLHEDKTTIKIDIPDAQLSQSEILHNQPIEKQPTWYAQNLFENMRLHKLESFAGLPIGRLSKLFERYGAYGLNLQYAVLAVMTVPALIQLTAQPLTHNSGILNMPYDLMQTGSVPPKSDFWSTGWKVAQGRALQLFSIESPETSGLSLNYTSRIHKSGLREDVLVWSKPDTEKKSDIGKQAKFSLQNMMVIQRDTPPQGFDTPHIRAEIVQRSKILGLSITKISTLSTIPSKFGPVEVLDIALEDKTKVMHSCVAFRTQAMQPNLKLSGWLCAEPASAVERPQVTCFINRLNLMGATHDKPLQNIFQTAEARRAEDKPTDCSSRTSYVQDNTRKGANWLEMKAVLPAFKGTLTTKE
jgi:hypothetical protein